MRFDSRVEKALDLKTFEKGDLHENLDRYKRSVLRNLKAEFKPETPTEILLVATVAETFAQLRRLEVFAEAASNDVYHKLLARAEKDLDAIFRPHAPDVEVGQAILKMEDRGEIGEKDLEEERALLEQLIDSSRKLEDIDGVPDLVYLLEIMPKDETGEFFPEGWREETLAFLHSLDPDEEKRVRYRLVSRSKKLILAMKRLLHWEELSKQAQRLATVPSLDVNEQFKLGRLRTGFQRSIRQNIDLLEALRRSRSGERLKAAEGQET